ATRTPRRASSRHSPVTTVVLPAFDVVPQTISAPRVWLLTMTSPASSSAGRCPGSRIDAPARPSHPLPGGTVAVTNRFRLVGDRFPVTVAGQPRIRTGVPYAAPRTLSVPHRSPPRRGRSVAPREEALRHRHRSGPSRADHGAGDPRAPRGR